MTTIAPTTIATSTSINEKPRLLHTYQTRRLNEDRSHSVVMRNIAENPTVALVVDVYDEDWRRLEYALVHGRAEVVENPEERRRALEALRDRYPQYRSMTLDAPHNEVVRITPARVHHWRFVG